MRPSIFIVKGISGSGKSSRVFQLIEFLLSRGDVADPLLLTQGFKRHQVGIILRNERLAIFGKRYKSGKVERWQGLDAVTACFGGSVNMTKFLIDHREDYTFIADGASVIASHRFRPKFLYEECGYKDIVMQYYNFEEHQYDEYIERTVLRTGKRPAKDSMWKKRASFMYEFAKCNADKDELLKDVKADADIVLNYSGYDTPIDDFGCLYLTQTWQGGVAHEFMEFVKAFNYINRNQYSARISKRKSFF